MFSRPHCLTHLLLFWPLVAFALIARLTFGGGVSPTLLTEDPIKNLTQLSILCDDQTSPDTPDGHHHHSADQQDDCFLLSETLELLLLSGAICLLIELTASGIHLPWMFAPIRGPPTQKRTALCPQGPPA